MARVAQAHLLLLRSQGLHFPVHTFIFRVLIVIAFYRLLQNTAPLQMKPENDDVVKTGGRRT